MLQPQRRSTTRTPLEPATTAACASPMNKPCSTTPAIPSRRSASDFGSAIRSNAASRIQCPPSVTKAWPSLARRSRAGPVQPTAAAAASTARRVAPNPNGTTSTRSGKRPSADPHFDSSAMTIMRPEAEATLVSRSSVPPPPLIRPRPCAIAGEIKLRRLVEAGERHAQPLGVAARRIRRGYRDHVEAGVDALSQKLDKMLGCGAAAKAKPHAGAHEFEGAGGGRTFLGIGIHRDRDNRPHRSKDGVYLDPFSARA